MKLTHADFHFNVNFYCTVLLLYFYMILNYTINNVFNKNRKFLLFILALIYYLFIHMSTGRSAELPVLGILKKLGLIQIHSKLPRFLNSLGLNLQGFLLLHT